jgi:hypothetical protein
MKTALKSAIGMVVTAGALATLAAGMACDKKASVSSTSAPARAPAAAEWVPQYTVVAQVKSVAPLAQSDARAMKVSTNPQHVITIHNIRPVLGTPPQEGEEGVSFAVANVARLLGTDQPPAGKWYRFTLTRSKVTGSHFLTVEPVSESPPPVRTQPAKAPTKA